jgi:hypothetical protein
MRLCFTTPCSLFAFPVPLDGFGSSVVATTTFVSGMNVVTATASHAPWSTRATTTIPGSTVFADIAHGPLSNSTTAGLSGGVLQFVTPTRILANPRTGFDLWFVTRMTITIIPEPASRLLLGAGVALLIGMHKLRRRRGEERP